MKDFEGHPLEPFQKRAEEFEGELLEDNLLLSDLEKLDVAHKLLQEIQLLHENNIAFRRSITPSHFKIDSTRNLVATGFDNAEISTNPDLFKKDIVALGVLFKGVLKLENLGLKSLNHLIESMINQDELNPPTLPHAIDILYQSKERLLQQKQEIDELVRHSLYTLYDLLEGNTDFKNGLEENAQIYYEKIRTLTSKMEETFSNRAIPEGIKQDILQELQVQLDKVTHSYSDTMIQLEERSVSQAKIQSRIERKEKLLTSDLSEIEIFTIPSNATKESLKHLDVALVQKLELCQDDHARSILEEVRENVQTCVEKKSADDLAYHDIRIPIMKSELSFFSGVNLSLDENRKSFTPSWQASTKPSSSAIERRSLLSSSPSMSRSDQAPSSSSSSSSSSQDHNKFRKI